MCSIISFSIQNLVKNSCLILQDVESRSSLSLSLHQQPRLPLSSESTTKIKRNNMNEHNGGVQPPDFGKFY